jgi:hypothetical protein
LRELKTNVDIDSNIKGELFCLSQIKTGNNSKVHGQSLLIGWDKTERNSLLISHNNMNESQKHYLERGKSTEKEYILYDPIYMKLKIWHN